MSEYQSAVLSTQIQLAGLVSDMVQDPILTQNLSWKLDNSVQQYLSGRIRPGEIESLYLYNQSCGVITYVHSKGSAKKVCPRQALDAYRIPTFFWSEENGIPLRGMIARIEGMAEGSLFIVAFVSLSEAWLKGNPNLSNYLKSMNVSIVSLSSGWPEKSIIFPRAGSPDRNDQFAGLAAKNPFLGYLIQKSEEIDLILDYLGNTLMLLSMILGILCFAVCRKQRNKFAGQTREFYLWCKGMQIKGIEGNNDPLEKNQVVSDDFISESKAVISEFYNKMHERIRNSKDANRMLLKTMTRLKEENSKYQNELLKYTKNESLTTQINHSSDYFVKNMEFAIDRIVDIEKTVNRDITAHSQSLLNLMMEWQRNIRQMTSRKFIRTLSEIQDSNGKSRLENQLESVIDKSRQVGNNAVKLNLTTSTIHMKLEKLLRISRHWKNLSNEDRRSGDIEPGMLVNALKESYLLLKEDPLLPAFSVAEKVDSSLQLNLLKTVPSPTLISAIYHIQLSLMLLAKNLKMKGFVLRTSLKIKGFQTMLIFSISENMNELEPRCMSHSLETKHHIEIAKRLLLNYRVKVHHLPTINDIPPVVVSWDDSVFLDVGETNVNEPFVPKAADCLL
ncbi:MAG: hypothetical protein HQK54_01785 [Oligoflexales bacterium]|nr:hypothetical protein [Oligoflexales bacterium]